MQIRQEKVVSIVTPELAAQMLDFKMKMSAFGAGYTSLEEWNPGLPPTWGSYPQAAFDVSEIYHGSADAFAYNHHHAISKLKDQYVASWSAARRDEDVPGQQVHYALSQDGKHWSPESVLVATEPTSGIVRNNAGLCADAGRLYDFVGVAEGARAATDPSLTSFVADHIRLDVYVTEDGINWKERQSIAENIYLFEGPHRLRDGGHLCGGSAFLGVQEPLALLWQPGQELDSPPQVIHIPWTDRRIRPVQGTWYQTDDGRIWMYFRDVGFSTRLALTWSDDGGQTWTDLALTDMPNTMSRASAGRLNDGRCYIIGNNYDRMLDRSQLQIALSDDGYSFDRMHTLIEGITHRRIDGVHKEDGWHYPNSLADGDDLFVIFSVNKEDIRCGVVNAKTMA